MRALIQRVSHASVEVEGKTLGSIQQGLLVLLGIAHEDTETDQDWLIRKVLNLRIFSDEEGKMNLSVKDIQGEILLISQFTLFANSKKGNRPSYIRSAPPAISIPMYERFLDELQAQFPGKVASGEFGADMKVSLLNDGPVTILLDSQQQDI
ncbi:MAG: D-aminoacyl-tRNA deacylase [Bacteroidota bacterium]